MKEVQYTELQHLVIRGVMVVTRQRADFSVPLLNYEGFDSNLP